MRIAVVVLLLALCSLGAWILIARGRYAAPAQAPEHAVLVHLKLSDAKFGTRADLAACQELELQLGKGIEVAGAGEMDGNEIGEGECVLFMYGPDADRLFAAIEVALRASPMARGGFVIKRYGRADQANARETRIDL